MNALSTKAPIIVLEGIDGVGKTAQTKMLLERLDARGITSCGTGPYVATEFCKEVKKLNVGPYTLQPDAQAALLIAGQCDCGRAMAAAPDVTHVMDRGWLSSLVYQGLAPGDSGSTRLLITGMLHYYVKYRVPDVVVLLELSPAAAYARLTAGPSSRLAERFKARGLPWLQQLQAGYEDVRYARWHPPPRGDSELLALQSVLLGKKLIVIDASGPADAVHAEVMRQLEKEHVIHESAQPG